MAVGSAAEAPLVAAGEAVASAAAELAQDGKKWNSKSETKNYSHNKQIEQKLKTQIL